MTGAKSAHAANWTVRGGFLRDPEGRAAILRGVNLSQKHKLPPYFDYHQPEDYRLLREAWGMNSLRFLISWAAIEPEDGTFDWKYLDEVERRLDWAHEAGLSVVLDMHQDIYGEGFASGAGNGAPIWTCKEKHYRAFKPIDPWFLNYLSPHVAACVAGLWKNGSPLQDHLVNVWSIVARRLGGHPAVLGFDPFNEPFWYSLFTFEKKKLGPFYDRVVATVRADAPHWVAFIEPAASRNFGIATRLPPFSYPNVVYAPHSYDPSAESGRGFNPKKRKSILKNIAKLALEARKYGAALWIGEYGGMPAKPGIFEYMDAQYDAAAAAAAGTMYWNYTKDDWYGMLDPDGNERPELMRALVRPYPERVAGDPLSYAFDDVSRAFTVSYLPDPWILAPTVISIPPRVYPQGYQVQCDGCAYLELKGKLWIVKPPRGARALVTITPAVP